MKYSTLRLPWLLLWLCSAAVAVGQTDSSGQPGQSGGLTSFGQPVHQDLPYRQKFSIKYVPDQVKDPGSLRLSKVIEDRNGIIRVNSSEGILRASNGQLLYPGKLVPDMSYRPMLQMTIRDIGLYEDQLICLNDKAVLSNAWAGRLYIPHAMPGATIFSVGSGFCLLLSDGKSLQFLKNSSVVWQGTADEPLTDIQFDQSGNQCWLLGRHSVSVFSITDRSLQIRYKGSDLTCFALTGKHNEMILGTHDGYFTINTVTGAMTGGVNRLLPCTDLCVIRSIEGRIWFGSSNGAFMLREDGKFDYYASERWIPSDSVRDIAPGNNGDVQILTDKGLGDIHFTPMTLNDKALYFEQQVRARHIRLGFNANISGMKNGDIDTGSLEDSDNDGLWTSMYLGAEVFRYAVTHSPEALQNCRESLDAMERLYSVNGMKGFPSRSFERRGFESADTQVWRRSAEPQWDWKSTTSSDEAIGHLFVYGVVAELVDDTSIKKKAIRLMDGLMQHIIDHDLYLVDWNGKPTTWGKWNPAYVNGRPPMVGDRKINSSNLIAMLQTAWHFTGKRVYRDKAFELMKRYGYLDNLLRPMHEIGPAPPGADDLSKRLSEGWNHSDDEMYFLGYWGLYRYAFNDTLKVKYKASILDHWQAIRPEKEGAWNLFTAMTGTTDFDLGAAIWYLQKYPMDLIDWSVKNSGRKDIVRRPSNFMGQTIEEVLPPDELPVNRHNTNRFQLDGGGRGRSEFSAGDIWLLPYWMGRYLQVISAPGQVISAPAEN